MEIQDGDMSKALVAITAEAASIPMPKLKNVNRLRTEHQVYELPDAHPFLEGMDQRVPDDPCPYLLAIWTPGLKWQLELLQQCLPGWLLLNRNLNPYLWKFPIFDELLERSNATDASGNVVLSDTGVHIQQKVQEAASGNIFVQMPDVWVNLAPVYFAQGHFALAVKMYQNCLRKFDWSAPSLD